MNRSGPLYQWLKKQPKEFVLDVEGNDIYGDSYMSLDKLRELDDKYNNPEGESNV